jgi:hypothetical protein
MIRGGKDREGQSIVVRRRTGSVAQRWSVTYIEKPAPTPTPTTRPAPTPTTRPGPKKPTKVTEPTPTKPKPIGGGDIGKKP